MRKRRRRRRKKNPGREKTNPPPAYRCPSARGGTTWARRRGSPGRGCRRRRSWPRARWSSRPRRTYKKESKSFWIFWILQQEGERRKKKKRRRSKKKSFVVSGSSKQEKRTTELFSKLSFSRSASCFGFNFRDKGDTNSTYHLRRSASVPRPCCCES